MSVTASLKQLVAAHVATKEQDTAEASVETIGDPQEVEEMGSPQGENGKAPSHSSEPPFLYSEYEDPAIGTPYGPDGSITYTKEESKMLRAHIVQFWGKNLTFGEFRNIFIREMKQADRNKKIDKEAVRKAKEHAPWYILFSRREAYEAYYL